MTRYATLAAILSQRIQQGLYPAGHRLPSVRTLSQEHGVSISTVQQAYRLLEEQRLVEARPKSGYFVHTQRAQAELPAMTAPVQRPVDISQWEQVLELVRSRPREGLIQLGRGMPDIAEPTMKPLIVALRNAARHGDLRSLYYDSIQGVAALREQVARLLLDSGCQIGPDQLLITTGCQEAISAGLRAVCQPGDIVAVDSPCFHGTMQTLKGLGIKALEIPTDPLTGVSLAALEMALEQWPVKAILLTPNCNNPLGYIMPDAHKQRLLTLAQRHDAAIIEDDVYGDIAYHYPRPRTIKSFDEDGLVFQNAGAGAAGGLDRARPLPGAGAAHEVHRLRRHRHPAAAGDRRIYPRRALSAAPAAYARPLPAEPRPHDRPYPEALPGRHPRQPAARRLYAVDRTGRGVRHPAAEPPSRAAGRADRRRQHLFRRRQIPQLPAHQLCT